MDARERDCSCTLVTEPPGAEIYADQDYLGRAPLTLDREDWILKRARTANRFTAKLTGYQTLVVPAPMRSLACDSEPYRLVRQ